MYADRAKRFSPAGAGAALAVNGALIAGLILAFAPGIVQRIEHPDIDTYFVPPAPPPPPPVDDTVKPKIEPRITDPQPYVPPVEVPSHADSQIVGTDIKPDIVRPETGAPTGTGEPAIERAALPPPLIGAVQDPRYAHDFQPQYPGIGIRTGIEGTVSVRVLIGTDGRVKAVEQVSATNAAFFEATRRQALSKWRFKPATRGGVPQESWKTMNVRFELSRE